MTEKEAISSAGILKIKKAMLINVAYKSLGMSASDISRIFKVPRQSVYDNLLPEKGKR